MSFEKTMHENRLQELRVAKKLRAPPKGKSVIGEVSA